MEEENNPLLQELRQGLGANSQKPIAQDKKSESTLGQGNENAKEEMAHIIAELKKKMLEIDKITQELEEKRKQIDRPSPRSTEKILQEIKVPPLELLK